MALFVGLPAKAPEIVLPIGPDQGTYSYVAERILAGGTPYKDAWDNKPPGTYYVHAAILSLLPQSTRWTRSCIPDLDQQCGYVALQAADVLWTLLTALALFALARRVTGSTLLGLVATALFAFFANVSQLSREGSTPEKQLLLPMVLAYLAVLRWWSGRHIGWVGMAGFAAGVAFLFKQTAVSIPATLVLWGLWEAWHTRALPIRRSLPLVGLFLAGWVVPVALTAAYLASQGALAAYWEAAYAYNINQAGTSALAVPRGFLAGAWQVFRGSSALLWLLALGGALTLWRSTAPLGRFALAWAAADSLSLFLGGSKFAQVYFVQVVPAYAVLGAVGVGTLWALTHGAWAMRAYAAAAAAGVLLLSSQFQAQVTLRAWYERTPPRSSVPPEQANGGAFRRLAERGPIFVWGDATQVYVLARGASPSRFFHTFPLSQVYASGTGYRQRRAELMRDLERTPPSALVIDPSTTRNDPDGSRGLNLTSFPELERFIEQRYQKLETIGLTGGWVAYELRS